MSSDNKGLNAMSISDITGIPRITVIRKLKKLYPNIFITEEDEAFTSKMAVQAMIEGGVKKKDRQKKGNLDKLSATFILKNYLENI